MERRVKDGVRAGATAVGVAAGFMALASTAQTPDGFVHASFGGPMNVFNTAASDVLAIGDGASDPSELASLLKTPVVVTTTSGPTTPYQAAIQVGGTTTAPTVSVFPSLDPTAAPATKDAAPLPIKPVVDSQGKVDCTGSVSCNTDPTTHVTTVTYPDGVVAIVQKINDLTVVAYKTITEQLQASVQAILPTTAPPVPPVMAATVPTPESAIATAAPTAEAATAAPETAAPTAIDPGPPAPETIDLGLADDLERGPKVNVTRPPLDFSPGGDASTSVPSPDLPNLPDLPKPSFPDLDKVKDALGSVVDSVKDTVGGAIKGKSANAETSGADETGPAGTDATKGGPGTSGAGSSGPSSSGAGNAGASSSSASSAGKSDAGDSGSAKSGGGSASP